MEIVAARNICKGEELTHSYVELVKHCEARRTELRTLYGFDCDCRRCCNAATQSNRMSLMIEIPMTWPTLPPNELTRQILKHYNPFATTAAATNTQEDDSTTMMMLDEESILKPLSNTTEAVRIAERKMEQARFCVMNDASIEEELLLLKEAVELLEKAVGNENCDIRNRQQQQRPLPSISSINLYKARGERLGSLIVASKTAEAVAECEHIVAFLCLASHHLGDNNYSLLGLQLFTLGDLYEASGEKEEA
ncbi:MAG: hypothetical protein SGILL_004931, partial [Bacillariaceae sp.]